MRNAVKKRMLKIEQKRREDWMEKEAEQRVLQMVSNEFTNKYPPGSKIVFNANRNQGEPITKVKCTWYNKIGGTPLNYKDNINNPPEWQNLTKEQAIEISKMFDHRWDCSMVYITDPKKPVEHIFPPSGPEGL
jgi:hypothetical protein